MQKPPVGSVADDAPVALAPLKHWNADGVKTAPVEIAMDVMEVSVIEACPIFSMAMVC